MVRRERLLEEPALCHSAHGCQPGGGMRLQSALDLHRFCGQSYHADVVYFLSHQLGSYSGCAHGLLFPDRIARYPAGRKEMDRTKSIIHIMLEKTRRKDL